MEKHLEEKQQELRRQEALDNFIDACGTNNGGLLQDLIDRAHHICKIVENRQYDDLQTAFNKLIITENSSLMILLPEHSGLGDISRLYIKDAEGRIDSNVFDHMKVEDSCDGAWQVYLSHSLWRILPLFWHALRSRRSYLFDSNDIAMIKPKGLFIKPSYEELASFNVNPKVVKSHGKYYISCCYWNDWVGLVRELVEVTINNGKVIEIFEVDYDVIYSYYCGILY